MVTLFFAVARDLTHLRGRLWLTRRTRTHMQHEINPTRLPWVGSWIKISIGRAARELSVLNLAVNKRAIPSRGCWLFAPQRALERERAAVSKDKCIRLDGSDNPKTEEKRSLFGESSFSRGFGKSVIQEQRRSDYRGLSSKRLRIAGGNVGYLTPKCYLNVTKTSGGMDNRSVVRKTLLHADVTRETQS